MNWYPHVTVASIVRKDGKYLLVKEESNGKIVYNQPAGHLEANETLIEAATRETLEETSWLIEPYGYLGVSQFYAPSNDGTYIRHSFVAHPIENKTLALDQDIIEALWLTYEEILALKDQLRSPLVLHDIERHRQGNWLDINTINVFGDNMQ